VRVCRTDLYADRDTDYHTNLYADLYADRDTDKHTDAYADRDGNRHPDETGGWVELRGSRSMFVYVLRRWCVLPVGVR
jgi:hypothetical protein